MFSSLVNILVCIAFSKSLQQELSGLHLRVVTTNQWPFIIKTVKNGSNLPEGFCVDLLNKILEGESISYSTQFVEEDNYSDNSSGLIGHLLSNKSDVIMAPLTITHSRTSILAFSSPYMDSQLGFVMMKRVEYPQWFGFVYIFDWRTWLMLLMTLLLFSVVFYGLVRFKASDIGESFIDCIIYAISVISSNGPTFTTHKLSSKLLSTLMWLFGLIFTTAFTANLTAAMVRNDLVKNDTIDDSIFLLLVFRCNRLHKKNPNTIFVNEVNMLVQHVQRPPCDLTLTKSLYSPEAGGGLAFAFRLETPNIRDLFSKKILKLKQFGELANLRRKWFQYTDECPFEKHSAVMSYSYFIGAFIIMLGGSLVSILIKLQEISICKEIHFKRIHCREK